MQNTIFEPQNLPEIPDAPMIDRVLFESGMTSALVILCIAMVLAAFFVRSTKIRPAALIAIVGILAATAVFMISAQVSTPREQITEKLTRLVDSVSDADASAMGPLLHESVQVRTRFGNADSRSRLINLVTTRSAPAISAVRITDSRVGLLGDRVARSLVKVKADSDDPIGTSWWIVDWSRPNEETSDWVATHIEPFWIQGIANPAGP